MLKGLGLFDPPSQLRIRWGFFEHLYRLNLDFSDLATYFFLYKVAIEAYNSLWCSSVYKNILVFIIGNCLGGSGHLGLRKSLVNKLL